MGNLATPRTPARKAQQGPAPAASEEVERKLLLAQADHARAAMKPGYGTAITGMTSEDFKALMHRLMRG